MTERGARKIVRRLEAAGWLEVQIGGGRGATNRFQLVMKTEPGAETRNQKPGIDSQVIDKPGTRLRETRNHGSTDP